MWMLLYQALLLLAWPWVQVRLRLRARREPGYGERIRERFGRLPVGFVRRCVWFHTVSAGETIAAAPVIAELCGRFPDQPFLVTTMTPTGSEQVRSRLGGRVAHCYAPYDFPWAVRRFFDAVQPRLLVLMETELWPNTVREAGRRGVPVLLVNARLSARSARGYRRLGALTRNMLAGLRCIACQYPDHARRFIELGAPADRVVVHGSVKFDVALPADHAARVTAWRERFGLGDAPVWIAASTHAGEESAALAAQQRLRMRLPDVRLILVPRHPARVAEVEAECARAGCSSVRLSAPGDRAARAEVVIGDTMGELLYLYALADAAFVGGSLNGGGGHNPIEPALCGLPTLMGPDVFNFPDVVDAFRDAGSLVLVHDPAQLAEVLGGWLADRAAAHAVGARAGSVLTANRGATQRLAELLERHVRTATGAPAAGARVAS